MTLSYSCISICYTKSGLSWSVYIEGMSFPGRSKSPGPGVGVCLDCPGKGGRPLPAMNEWVERATRKVVQGQRLVGLWRLWPCFGLLWRGKCGSLGVLVWRNSLVPLIPYGMILAAVLRMALRVVHELPQLSSPELLPRVFRVSQCSWNVSPQWI